MNWPTWLPLRKDLTPLTPYGAPQVPAQASLNTNENPYSPSPALQKAIADAVMVAAANLNRYPDRDASELRSKLAGYINSTGQGSALGFTPSYSMHPLIAKVCGTNWVDGKRNSDFSLNVELAVEQIAQVKPALTFITTPNNPTGGSVSISQIKLLADSMAKVNGLLIVDEAYAEFSTEDSAVTLIAKNPHVVVIRTMSKAFAFAGARVGYMVCDSSVKDAMMLVRLPYHLSALTQAAASVAIDFKDELLGYVSELIRAREAMTAQLLALGLKVVPSSANFILFTGFSAEAPKLWSELLGKGVLIRDVGLPGYLRVTIGNEAENTLFINALKELI
ncbi:MAG: hypothetical protein RL690_373 [Actinomycetota bacterium]